MEATTPWMHYCEEGSTKVFVLCNITNLKEIFTWKYPVPYNSVFPFDSVQVKNVVYFCGGGVPKSEQHALEYFRVMIEASINDKMEVHLDRKANMLVPRANHTLTAIRHDILYVVGGENTEGCLNVCEMYNLEHNQWRSAATLQEKKKWVSVVLYNNQFLYAFGGCTGTPDKQSDLIETLDTQDSGAKHWTVVKLTSGAELWTKGYHFGLAQIADNCVLVFGGQTGKTTSQTCCLFKPVQLTLEPQRKLLAADSFSKGKLGSAEDSIVIVGSHNYALHLFHLPTKRWDLMSKSFWNPVIRTAYKSETF